MNKLKFIIDSILMFIKFLFGDGPLNYKNLFVYIDRTKLHPFIEKAAKELAEKENLPVLYVDYEELNKNMEKETLGLFISIRKDQSTKYKELMEKLIKESLKNNVEVPKTYIYPRIELSEKSDIFTFLHELGHYYIYKHNKIQSEESANAYIAQFFEEHLPDFFSWVFNIELEVYANKKVEYSNYQSYIYYNKYIKWIKENN